MNVNFGKTAGDYVIYRAGYPEALFRRLMACDIGLPGQNILDIGTGTGYLARPLANQKATVTGLDPSAELLAQAKQLDQKENVTIRYIQGKAEQLPFAGESFDVVTAGQCWHWFQRSDAACEVYRVLNSGGKVAIVILTGFLTREMWFPSLNS